MRAIGMFFIFIITTSCYGARVDWDLPPGLWPPSSWQHGTFREMNFPPGTISTWDSSNGGGGAQLNGFSIVVKVTTPGTGREVNWVCTVSDTSNNGYCSSFPRPTTDCRDPGGASAFFASLEGVRVRIASVMVPTTGRIEVRCSSRGEVLGYKSETSIIVGPEPVSCATNDLLLSARGAVGEDNIIVSNTLVVVCTGASTVRLDLGGGGNVSMTGGGSALVSFAGGRTSVTMNADPTVSIPVTARFLTPGLSAGSYSGAIVLTTTVE